MVAWQCQRTLDDYLVSFWSIGFRPGFGTEIELIVLMDDLW